MIASQPSGIVRVNHRLVDMLLDIREQSPA
jgi:hypothetical protein